MQCSKEQERWHEWFEATYTYVVPVRPFQSAVKRHREEAIMARKITLPARANALVYTDTEVADVLLSLYDAPQGEGVVVDDAQDTEPKARVRCRVMAKALESDRVVSVEEAKTMDVDNIDPTEEFDRCDENGDANEEGEFLFLPGVKTRTHTVKDGDTFLPVLSLKSQS